MSAAVYVEPYKLPAGAMALAVHAMFFALLYFGVNWRADPPQGMEATLWTPEMMSTPAKAAPQVAHIRVEPPPVEPPPVEQVEPPKPPEPSKLVEHPKLAEPVQPVVPPKADIELAEKKKQKELAEKERQKAKLAEIKKQMEQKKIIEAEKARQSAQAERERVRAEQAAQAAQAEQDRARAAQAVAIGRVVDEHKARIVAKIRRNIVMPPGVPDNARAEFDVTLLPGGSVLSAKLTKPSGKEAYDSAVERAIFLAQPLPLPQDVALFNKFRELHLIFSPKE